MNASAFFPGLVFAPVTRKPRTILCAGPCLGPDVGACLDVAHFFPSRSCTVNYGPPHPQWDRRRSSLRFVRDRANGLGVSTRSCWCCEGGLRDNVAFRITGLQDNVASGCFNTGLRSCCFNTGLRDNVASCWCREGGNRCFPRLGHALQVVY